MKMMIANVGRWVIAFGWLYYLDGAGRVLDRFTATHHRLSGVILSLFLLLASGCAPAGEPWPADGRCGIECLDPAYPVICEVERLEGVIWTCAVDGDACKAVPGLVCTP